MENQTSGPTPDDVVKIFLAGLLVVVLIAAGFAFFLYLKMKGS